jgi:hypothetical protein
MKDEQGRKGLEEMRVTYEMLISEIKYNSELKIKEILQEAVKEKKKVRMEFEKRVAAVKQKQWVTGPFGWRFLRKGVFTFLFCRTQLKAEDLLF